MLPPRRVRRLLHEADWGAWRMRPALLPQRQHRLLCRLGQPARCGRASSPPQCLPHFVLAPAPDVRTAAFRAPTPRGQPAASRMEVVTCARHVLGPLHVGR